MNKLVALLLLSLLPFTLPAKEKCSCHKYPEITYGTIGLWSLLAYPMTGVGIDIAVGQRTFYHEHAFDRNIGLVLGANKLLYGQASYLYYFYPHKDSPYLGIGLTVGIAHLQNIYGFLPYANIPLTAGYQFAKGDFIQLQVTPLATVTATYGIKF